MSARRLSRLMAERTGNQPESYRRAISKWLAGEGIADGSAVLLSDLLGKPDDHFKQPRVSSAELLRLVEQIAADVAVLQGRLDALEQRPGPSERR